ncbi:histidine kinase [Streptomyces sp. NBC_01808]|uniref:sensor histidine kinase n=1 Tax=Streptomyces sp. NBC_01808 TaxID=2975947 RepID=UPI002DDC6D10|nr:histidine kinase [Streptomyces sp. NBC_01808]WSA40545.1 histidine kinase [Streptomyces sp. NBC_01808]
MSTAERPVRRALLTPPQLRLLLAAGFVFVVFKSVRAALTGQPGLVTSPAASAVVAGALCAVLPLCRRMPVPVAAVTGAGLLLESQVWPVFIALYGVTLWRPRGTAIALTGAVFVPAAFGPFRELVNMPQVVLFPCAILAVPLAVGLAVRSQRDLAGSLARQLEHLEAANRLRDEQVRMAERARIAREMHDVLAHRLSLLVLHTGVLQRRGDAVPEPVRERLDLLRTTSAHALDDLRDLLGALRDHEGPVPLAPTADDLPALIAESERAGTRVRARTDDLAGLPAAVRLAAHRIVQEALTNARKHAPGTPVGLTVTVTRTRVAIRAENECGMAPEPQDGPSRGYGLVGIAERVAALHGELTTGRTGDGRFVLTAELPVPVHPVEEPPALSAVAAR